MFLLSPLLFIRNRLWSFLFISHDNKLKHLCFTLFYNVGVPADKIILKQRKVYLMLESMYVFDDRVFQQEQIIRRLSKLFLSKKDG